MRKPGVNFDIVDAQFIQINPVTGNRQLIMAANDIMDVIERLGNIEAAALRLGVEEIEVHHWIDDHHIPTRYAEKIMKLIGWKGIESLQQPSVGTDWT